MGNVGKGSGLGSYKMNSSRKMCIQYTNNHQTLPHDQANTYESLGVTKLPNIPDI